MNPANPARLEHSPAVIRHRVRLLVVVGKAPSAALALTFVATAPKVLRFVERHKPQVISRVYGAPRKRGCPQSA